VLIIDEAQGLPPHLLEEIRVLLNLETPQAKLLQVILAGQPELEDKLKQPELRPFRQRITLRCKTAPLTLDQTRSYIGSRLHYAGANNHKIFAARALDAVYLYSRGIPRVINLLCEHALINAYSQHSTYVFEQTVRTAARDCELDELATSAAFAGCTEPLDILDPRMYAPIEEMGQTENPAAVDVPCLNVPLAPVSPHSEAPLQSSQILPLIATTSAASLPNIPERKPQRTLPTPQPPPPPSRPDRGNPAFNSAHVESQPVDVRSPVPTLKFFSRLTSIAVVYARLALSRPWFANLSKIPRSFLAELNTHPRDFKIVYRSFIFELKSHPATLWFLRRLSKAPGIPCTQVSTKTSPRVAVSNTKLVQDPVTSHPRPSSRYRANRSTLAAIAAYRLTVSALRWLQKPINTPSARNEAPPRVERRKVQR
jgi:hypothetical protein